MYQEKYGNPGGSTLTKMLVIHDADGGRQWQSVH
jgi:hypothetical protein